MKTALKSTVAAEIADYVILALKPHETPCVIMWRECINGFNARDVKDGNGPTPWCRDDASVHEHFKKFAPDVIANLEQRYRLTVVKVSNRIRGLVKHGSPPDLSVRRNDEAYRRCLPGKRPTMGLVVFPRDTRQDHPLIVWSRRRNMVAAASHLDNASQRVNAAKDLGTLSSHQCDDIHLIAVPVSTRIIQEGLPLFRKAIEGPRETEVSRADA